MNFLKRFLKPALLGLLVFVATYSIATFAFADAIPNTGNPTVNAILGVLMAPPAWLVGLLGTLVASFPKIGAIIVLTGKWAAIVGVILTVVAVAIDGLVAALAGVLNVAGLQSASGKVKEIAVYVQYAVKFFSMFNAQPPAVALAKLKAASK